MKHNPNCIGGVISLDGQAHLPCSFCKKAQELADNNAVRRAGDRFLVKDGENEYPVYKLDTGKVVCHCADFRGGFVSHPKYRCVHIVATKLAIRAKNTEPVVDEKYKGIYEKVGYKMEDKNELSLNQREVSFDIKIKLAAMPKPEEKPLKISLEKIKNTDNTRLVAEYESCNVEIVGVAEYTKREEGDFVMFDFVFSKLISLRVVEK